MSRVYSYMGTGQPSDPRWHSHSDADAKWCVTRRAPVMQLLVARKIWGFTMSVAPPEGLIGHKVGLHCGVGHVPLKDIADSARAAIATLRGVTFEDWRAALSMYEAEDPGRFIGSATLVAAFRVGGLSQECVRPYRVDSLGHTYLGDWQRFFGRQIRPVGDWSEGRWLWCFDHAAAVPAAEKLKLKCKGFGWVWDAAKGVKVRQRQAKGVAA